MPYFSESQLEQSIIALHMSDMKHVLDKTINN